MIKFLSLTLLRTWLDLLSTSNRAKAKKKMMTNRKPFFKNKGRMNKSKLMMLDLKVPKL